MGTLDFLFGGSPPPNSAPTGGSRNIPQWMSDASMDYINKVKAVSQMPYQAYDGPRLAGPSANEQTAWDTVGQTAGKFNPAIKGALTSSEGTVAGSDPYFKSGASDIGAGTGTFTGQTVNNYMDPYEQNVINRGADLATRNFQEKILPGLNSQFVASGQYGSLGHQAEADRAARDVTQNIQDTSNSELAGAYDAARTAQGADASRSITAGSALGTLGSNRGALSLNAATTTGQLAQNAQDMGYRDATALDTVGQEQTGYNQRGLDLRTADFNRQNDYLKNQLNWEGASLNGAPPQSTSFNEVSPAGYDNPSPLAAGAAGAGLASVLHSARGGVVSKAEDDIPGWLHAAMKELWHGGRRGALSAA